MSENNCVWCGAGISATEKFCSQCGGPNAHYSDVKSYGLPMTNLGKRVTDYKVNLVKGRYTWNLPRIGTLRRLIVETPRTLEKIKLIENGSFVIANVVPKSNQFIYTGEIFLQTQSIDCLLDLESNFVQEAIITLEYDDPEVEPYHVNGGVNPLRSMVRSLQGR